MNTEMCTIHFMDGQTMKFEFESSADDKLSMANEIHKFMDTTTLCFKIDGKLVYLPTANIKMIVIDPAPDNLPNQILHGGTHVE